MSLETLIKGIVVFYYVYAYVDVSRYSYDVSKSVYR